MSERKRLVMEVDYYDNAWHGCTRASVEKMFENCARAGILDMYWGVTGVYPSKVFQMYDGADRRQGAKKCTEVLRSFDGLAAAVEFGRKYGIKILAYLRLFDDYWIGTTDPFIESLGHGWWESRCGHFQLKGWPCYHVPEVMEYKLRIVRELIDYGVDGFLFALTRSHSLYANPCRQPDFFGYNQPVADEFKRRYGVDIRKFDYLTERMTCAGDYAQKDIFFVNGVNYAGTEAFDLKAWHDLKGESAVDYVRRARKMAGPKAHIAIECTHYNVPPVADPNDPYPAKMYFYPDQMAKEGIINEWTVSMNWRRMNFDFDGLFFPNFQYVADTGVTVTAWLNDIFSPTGGDENWCNPRQVEQYLEAFEQSKIQSASLHEEDGIEQNPRAGEIWEILRRFSGR
jgi:hypothetical protein